MAIMVHMSTTNHRNNAILRKLIEAAGLTQREARELFNKGQAKQITESGFKAWLAAPESVRWREMSDSYRAHAERVLEPRSKKRTRGG
jgi:uncharacterized protein YehS (DUF1456 family)